MDSSSLESWEARDVPEIDTLDVPEIDTLDVPEIDSEQHPGASFGRNLQEKLLIRQACRVRLPSLEEASSRTRERIAVERAEAVLKSYGHGALTHEEWCNRKKNQDSIYRKKRASKASSVRTSIIDRPFRTGNSPHEP